MALNFPASPTVGQTYTSGGKTWRWDGIVWASYTDVFSSVVIAVPDLDINCSLGNYFTKTITTNSTFTFSNAPSNTAYSFTLELTHIGGTVTWPTGVKWPKDSAPSLTIGKTHLFMFVTDDSGTRWRGAVLADYEN